MKINIYGNDYDLLMKTNEEIKEEIDVSDGLFYHGIYSWSKQMIWINKDIPNRCKLSTIVHESIHAIVQDKCLGKQKFTEEELCRFIENHYQEIEKIIKQAEKIISSEDKE